MAMTFVKNDLYQHMKATRTVHIVNNSGDFDTYLIHLHLLEDSESK